MLEAGYVTTLQEAFDRFLAKGKPAYVDKVRLSPSKAIALLRENGFAPVLAHPISLQLSPNEWLEKLPVWKDWGLVGLEVFHPNHDVFFTDFIAEMAERFSFVSTAGSDYHGANKSTPITWVNGNSPIGLEVLETLKNAIIRS
jgi:predicted metal-dependent phosphoesterase TrpH